MEIYREVCNMFEENTYIIWDETTRQAAIVDPGMLNAREQQAVDDFISRNNFTVKMILLTHGHLDHTFGLEHAREKYGAEVIGHTADAPLLRARQEQARRFGLPYRLQPVELDREIGDGDKLYLGDQEIKAICAPGHSQGSIVYYVPQSQFVLTGDVLFKSGIGRTDLPGGSMTQLIDSIQKKLLTLPGDTVVYPGHGQLTTIAAESFRF